jgi:hypothetical protein
MTYSSLRKTPTLATNPLCASGTTRPYGRIRLLRESRNTARGWNVAMVNFLIDSQRCKSTLIESYRKRKRVLHAHSSR